VAVAVVQVLSVEMPTVSLLAMVAMVYLPQ
jgi:hypothetical protein